MRFYHFLSRGGINCRAGKMNRQFVLNFAYRSNRDRVLFVPCTRMCVTIIEKKKKLSSKSEIKGWSRKIADHVKV